MRKSTPVTRMPIRIFFDSSALFASAYSATGGSRELMRLAFRGQVAICVSQDVLEETQRNLSTKAPELTVLYAFLLALLAPQVVADPSRKEVWEAENHVAQKDAPIVAAAKKAKAALLVTLDRKHLPGKPELERFVGVPIVTPKEALTRIKPAD